MQVNPKISTRGGKVGRTIAIRATIGLLGLGMAVAVPTNSRGQFGRVGAAKPATTSTPRTDPMQLRAAREAENKIRTLLATAHVEEEKLDGPIRECVPALCRKAGIENVTFDTATLKASSIDVGEKDQIVIQDQTLSQALGTALDRFGIGWVVRNEGLVFTAAPAVEDLMVTRQYDVGALRKAIAEAGARSVPRPNGVGGTDAAPPEMRTLIALVTESTSGPWSKSDGAGGTITPLGTLLSVKHNEKVQAEVENLLQTLSRFVQKKLPSETSVVVLNAEETASRDRLMQALAKPVGPFEFKGKRLKDAIDQLGQQAGMSILINELALQDEGHNPAVPVEQTVGKSSLRSALQSLLAPHKLATVIQHGRVVVTTESVAENHLETLLFDVRDLIAAGLDTDTLAEVLRDNSGGTWRDSAGIGGALSSPLPGAIIVEQSRGVQQEIASFLDDLRQRLARGDDIGASKENEEAVTLRFYPIDLKGRAAQVEEALQEFVAPETWKKGGGAGSIRRIDETLCIQQTAAVHRAIGRFLKDLKKAEDREPTIR